MEIDDVPFHDLQQAAIAGAEGTAWSMPEFASCPPVPPMYADLTVSDTLPSFTSSFQAASSIPIPIKEEHTYASVIPSSPTQQSLCSLSSFESYARSVNHQPIALSQNNLHHTFPRSPVSVLTKPSSASSPSSPHSSPSLSPSPSPSLSPSPSISTSPSLSLSTSPASVLSSHHLTDLKGTTAARSRKMSEEERRIMLHKRRLRNRASAARSREKRSRTLIGLTAEVEQLIKSSARLALQANQAVEEARKLKAQNILLLKENELLKSELRM